MWKRSMSIVREDGRRVLRSPRNREVVDYLIVIASLYSCLFAFAEEKQTSIEICGWTSDGSDREQGTTDWWLDPCSDTVQSMI